MKPSPSLRELNKYRLLDIDDLIIIKMLGDGHKYSAITRVLGITAPAISHRVKKYEEIWPGFSVRTPTGTNRKRVFSHEFPKVHRLATDILDALRPEEEVMPLAG